jgi:terminase small subunit-like protein
MKRALTPTDIVIRDEILKRLEAGQSLREICREAWAPSESTVRGWASDRDDDFSAQYARARLIGYSRFAEEIVEIADQPKIGVKRTTKRERLLNFGVPVPGSDVEKTEETEGDMVDRDRLRVDTRKWLLAKMLPKVYGDKVAVESSGPDGGPIQHEVKAVHALDPVQASQVYQKLMGE